MGGCIGVTGVVVAPGQTQEKLITVPLDPGTYRINYTFDMLGMGMQNATAYSDPFDVS
jgi:hypothetical protein